LVLALPPDDRSAARTADQAAKPAAAVGDMPARLPAARFSAAPAVPSHLMPLFAAVAREHAVPAGLLMAVAAAESGFDARAVSPKGAMGLMQLMPQTARELGVHQVWSALDNLRGGAAHLKGLLVRFAGDPGLALAAYNAGERAVIEAGRQIPAFDETRRYVPKVLAWRAQYQSLVEAPVQHMPAHRTAVRKVNDRRFAAMSDDRTGSRAP
jgi:soluble lytic murein transglycosylase-like protein